MPKNEVNSIINRMLVGGMQAYVVRGGNGAVGTEKEMPERPHAETGYR